MPSLTGLGILSFPFPGTAVPGYRLFRPYGTGPSDRAKVPLLASQVRPSDSLAHEPAWTSCHSTAGLLQYERRVDEGWQQASPEGTEQPVAWHGSAG